MLSMRTLPTRNKAIRAAVKNPARKIDEAFFYLCENFERNEYWEVLKIRQLADGIFLPSYEDHRIAALYYAASVHHENDVIMYNKANVQDALQLLEQVISRPDTGNRWQVVVALVLKQMLNSQLKGDYNYENIPSRFKVESRGFAILAKSCSENGKRDWLLQQKTYWQALAA